MPGAIGMNCRELILPRNPEAIHQIVRINLEPAQKLSLQLRLVKIRLRLLGNECPCGYFATLQPLVQIELKFSPIRDVLQWTTQLFPTLESSCVKTSLIDSLHKKEQERMDTQTNSPQASLGFSHASWKVKANMTEADEKTVKIYL